MKRIFLVGILLLPSIPAVAQMPPYAGMQTRPIKALSSQQISDLREGRGMGLAMAAELNGYPGPMHVLEHAKELTLNADQRVRIKALYDSMKAEATSIGSRLIAQETELDRGFAGRTVTPSSLKLMTAAIAMTQGELRETHLKYHLSTADILSAAQKEKYATLRGYAGGKHKHHKSHHH